jgi:TadE-like protein
MVEFVLVAPLLFLLVGGIVQVALALNYWLDMQRIANQGARWAVVARYPVHPPSPQAPICDRGNAPCSVTLPQSLADEAQSAGLHPDVSLCFPSGSSNVGEPVRVQLQTGFTFVPILRIGTVTLSADAEMRIEQQRGSVYQPTPDC